MTKGTPGDEVVQYPISFPELRSPFEITKANNRILVIRLTAQSQTSSMACYYACLKWMLRFRFPTAGQGERSSGTIIKQDGGLSLLLVLIFGAQTGASICGAV